MKGVLDTAVGYCGGSTKDPTYPAVCSGATGHAETVELSYDPSVISYRQLLKEFWAMHDPTQGNRQGWNFGNQYRSAIFCADDEQLAEAIASRDELQEQLKRNITTEIKLLEKFWRAEEYHQQYYLKKGVSACRVP